VRIGIIGGGFMGEAFLRGLIRAKVAAPNDIAVSEIVEPRRLQLQEHGVRVTKDAESACIGADVVILAVKPQDLPAVAQGLQGAIPKEAVVISIAAGIPLDDIRRYTGHRASARVMPNLLAAIGAAAAMHYLSPDVTPEQRKRVVEVAGAVATAVVEAHSDDELDLGTAVHGSGPAYVYLFIESMIDAAVRQGMKRADAEQLVLATVQGSAQYAIETGQHPAQLRNAVTSPGGTTAAGLAELEAAGFRTAIDAAIEAAYERARELGE
jgi:pyrroline-5-carboxylate reductase